MKQETLKVLEEERSVIQKEIDTLNGKISSLTEEVSAIDIVLLRHSNNKADIKSAAIGTAGSSITTLDHLTNSERRVYVSLDFIGGEGTVNDIFDQMSKDYPDEIDSKLHSSARQYASILRKKEILDAEEQGGNKPNIYKIVKRLDVKKSTRTA